jgi:hypothetical protein
MISYETDPRPFADCLREFAVIVNGGKVRDSRQRAAEELRAPEATVIGWMSGRSCAHEASFRRLMTMIAKDPY